MKIPVDVILRNLGQPWGLYEGDAKGGVLWRGGRVVEAWGNMAKPPPKKKPKQEDQAR